MKEREGSIKGVTESPKYKWKLEKLSRLRKLESGRAQELLTEEYTEAKSATAGTGPERLSSKWTS